MIEMQISPMKFLAYLFQRNVSQSAHITLHDRLATQHAYIRVPFNLLIRRIFAAQFVITQGIYICTTQYLQHS